MRKDINDYFTKSQKEYLQNVINAWKEAGKEMSKEDYEKILKMIDKL